MKRRKLSSSQSKKIFKKGNGVRALNNMNPRGFRGGIRL